MNGTELAESLRSIAEAVDGTPIDVSGIGFTPVLYYSDPDEMAEAANLIGGTWEVRLQDQYLYLDRHFGDIRMSLFGLSRNLCEEVEVGVVTQMEWQFRGAHKINRKEK